MVLTLIALQNMYNTTHTVGVGIGGIQAKTNSKQILSIWKPFVGVCYHKL